MDNLLGTNVSASENSAAPSYSSAAVGAEEHSFEVTALQAGHHSVSIEYANGWADKHQMSLSRSGHEPITVDFPSTGSWAVTGRAVLELPLAIGVNTLVFSGDHKIGPTLKDISTSLLTGDVEDDATTDDTIVLIQNLAAITALSALAHAQTAEAATKEPQSTSQESSDGVEDGSTSDRHDGVDPMMADDDRVGSGSPLTEGMSPSSSVSGSNVPGQGLPQAGEINVSIDTTLRSANQDVATMNSVEPSTPATARGHSAPAAATGASPTATTSLDAVGSKTSGEAEEPVGNGAFNDPQDEVPQVDGASPQTPGSVQPNSTDNSELQDGFVGAAPVEAAAFVPLRLQAESATLGFSGSAATTNPKVVDLATASLTDQPNADAADGDAYVDFAGAGSDNNAGSGQYIEWTFSVAEAGFYDIDIGYAFSAANVNRSMRMDVNGELWDRIFDMRSTGANTTYSESTTRVYLDAGDNTIRLTANGFSGPNIDYLDVRAPDPNVFIFQGEDLAPDLSKTENTDQLTNRAIATSTLPNTEQFRTGGEGEAYLDWAATTAGVGSPERAKVAAAVADFTFDAVVAGTYTVTLTYASSGPRPLDLKQVVDGEASVLTTFQILASPVPQRLPTDRLDLLGAGDNHDTAAEINGAKPTAFEGWTTETVTINLEAGVTTLRLQLAAGGITGPNIDKVQVSLLEAAAPEPVAPSAITIDNLVVGENAPGAAVGTVIVTDADSFSHKFEVRENGDISTRFEVVDGALRLKDGVTLDYEGTNTFPLTVTATDDDGQSFTREFTVTVTNDTGDDVIPNTAPVFTVAPVAAIVDENTTGTVATFTATDSEGDVSYSLDGADGALFTISTTGAVSFKAAPDAETATDVGGDNVYELTVVASDGTLSASTDLTVTVADINEAPALAGTLTDSTLPSTGGTISLSNLVASDPDIGDTTTLGVRASSGTLPTGISIVNGALVVADGVAAGDYALQIFANDGDLDSNSVSFTLTVDAPVVEEPEPFTQILIQAEAGALTVLDKDSNANDTTIRNPNNQEAPGNPQLINGLRPGFSGSGYLDFGDTAGDKATYTFTVTEAGSYDINVRYASNGARPLSFMLDGAAQPDLPFVATGSSTAGPAEGFNNWSVQTVTVPLSAGMHTMVLAIPAGAATGPNVDAIAITTVGATPNFSAPNSLPVVAESSFSVMEGETIVGNLTATDLDGDKVTYSLTPNEASDNALFTIDGSTGALAFLAAPDFDAPEGDNSYVVEIAASDGTAVSVKTIAVSVTNDPSDDMPVAENTAPEISSEPSFTVAENAGAGAVVGTIVATDVDGDSLTYTLSGADAGKLSIDQNGVVSLVSSPDFETFTDANSDGIFEASATVSDGSATATQDVAITVTNVNEAPTSVALSGDLTLEATAAAGTVVGTLSAVDPDGGDAVSFTVDDERFTVSPTGDLVVAAGASFDFAAEPSFAVTVTATDAGGMTKTQAFTLAIEDIATPVDPTGLVFGNITSYSSQDRPQDGGDGATLSDGGSTLTLDGNLWKRAVLGESYAITRSSLLVFDVKLSTGADASEVVAIGFDLNENPFDGQRTLYQLGGTQTQGGFVDLRGSGTLNPDGTTRFAIDLGVHAGTAISSLVFINDDDTKASLGTSTFSNVQFADDSVDGNIAPVVVGGGIGDRTVLETGSIEVDLPFTDADGDALTYTFTVTDAAGNAVTSLGNLAIVDGVLSGDVEALGNGVFTVTVTASDGTATKDDVFVLTVQNVNDAPVAEDVALEPYFAAVGAQFEGFDVNYFVNYFTDADGDELTLSVVDLPDGLTINEEGYVSGSPTEAGTYQIKVRASDPSGAFDEIVVELIVDGPQVGDVISVEAEAFTGLGEATGFFATGSTAASGDRLILLNQNGSGSVSTDLAANGLATDYYKVTAYVFDETDGASTFSLSMGGAPLLAGGSSTVTLNDAGPGTFVNPSAPRGTVANTGNLKAIAFETLVFVDGETIATLSGQAKGGESLRIDRLEFTRIEAPDAGPDDVTLTGSVEENAAGAVVGILSARDADGDAVTFTTTDERFVIVENDQTGAVELRLAAGVSLDHEIDDGTQVSVTATDAGGIATTADVTLTVNDIDEAPVLADGATIADVTLTAGDAQSIDLAALLDATDPEGAAVSYGAQLAGGATLPAGITLADGSLVLGETLVAGTYEIEVFASDGELDSESVSFTVTVEDSGTEEPGEIFQPIVIQAETGTIALIGDTVTTDDDTKVRDADHPENNPSLENGLRPGFTGTGYMDFGNDAGDVVTYTTTVAEAGTYDLNVRYASQAFQGAPRSLALGVNGADLGSKVFPDTGPSSGPTELQGFNVWQVLTQSVTLTAGVNTITFAIPAGATAGPNLDRIEITRPDGGLADISADADDIPLFLSGPDGELTGANLESINFNIAGRDDDIVKAEISFDGGVTRALIGPDGDGDFVTSGSALPPGSYTATVYVTDEAGNEASASMAIVVGGGDEPVVEPFTIQAEDATQVTVQDTGVATSAAYTRVVDAAHPDSSGAYRTGGVGGAYMDFGGNAGDAITINVDAPVAGTYLVTFRYANGGVANRPLDLSLNGEAVSSVDFAPGAVVGTGATATGWESWEEQTVELTLAAGSNAVKLAIPAGATAGPNIDQITFTHQAGEGPTDPVEPFLLTVEGETFAPNDDTGTGNQITQARTPDNQEPNLPLVRDANSDGLWDGFTGDGYLDMGAQIGDAASFTVDAPSAGTYTFTFRYSNGGGAPNGDRPMTLSVGGETTTVSFPGTGVNGWDDWQTATVEVDLAAGVNTVSIANTVANGPNIDNVTISRDGDPVDPVDPREQIRFEEVVKINFEPAPGQTTQGLPADYVTPAGYLADTGAAFGLRTNGLSYGWVTETSVADGTGDGTVAAAQPANAHWYKNTVPGASDLQKTYAHFEYPGAGTGGSRAWEMALDNGTYQVKMSVGDTAGAFDSNYNINVEGQSFLPDWIPANPIDGSQNGGGFRSTLVTGTVTVTDGRLTIDSIGGTNTEIQYLEVERIPDLTPGDGRSADRDFSTFVAPVAASIDGQVSIALGANGELPVDIDPTSFLVVGINIQAEGNRGPNIAYVDGIKLVETLTGAEVAIDVQISGGADSVTIRPLQQLKENTSYTLKVQDVMDLGSIEDANAPLRQMQDLTTTFVTGEAPEVVARDVAFTTDTLLNGFADGAGGYTAIEFGPDGKLYVATITGEIHRWTVNSNGTIDKTSQETVALDYLDAGNGERRGIVGFTFDPTDPNTIWITDNAPIPREQKAFDTPEFSGRVSKLTLGEGGSLTDATAETYLSGLPRSGADHLTNSLEFRANPNAGDAGEPDYLLYLSQGSNSAAGAPDGAWGNRPERLLNAAILEIDPTKTAPQGGFNVQTEPLQNGNPTTQNPASAFNEDGTYPGFYNPYLEDAVLKIFATGTRNAYDLVWHSNGHLYVPTNGTASGGKTPQDPTQSNLDTTINNSPKQYDYFFTVDEGGYYGHPNVLRDQYILNGGNPTSGKDPNEVVGGNDGNRNTDGYATGTQTDPNYDLDGVYNLGYNRSPNGATEYTGNAFGSNLKGAILFAQFSTGDNVRVIRVDADGKIIGDDVLRRPDGSVIDDYIDPLDIIQNPVTGQLYLMTLNRGTGASQLILLTPAPGGATQDLTADEGNNLALVVLDASDPAAAAFQINGLDDDITAVRISLNGAAPITVTPDAQGRFTLDLGSLTGSVTATLEVTDDALNRASKTTTFTPGQGTDPEPSDFVSLVTIQAEDRTPADGTAVTVATGVGAQIQIRDASNPETSGGTALVGGLRPGAFGTDGNTVNNDGTPGGYADFGTTNADFMTFTFNVSSDQAGTALLRFRYGNGDATTATDDGGRPLQVEVNGTIVAVNDFLPGSGATTDERLADWRVVEIPASLISGTNTVTLRSIDNTGPNIDQLEVLVPAGNGTDPEAPNDGEVIVDGVTYVLYEAENAEFGGAAVVTEERNQSGDAFVDFVGTADQSISWTISVDAAGSYNLDFLYALGAGKAARPLALSLNGQGSQTLSFAANSNAGETTWGPQAVTLDLVAGTNTVTLTAPSGVGPNVDALRVTKQPISVFEPDYADIEGSGRIQLEADDGSAHTVNGSTVDFYFTVGADGVYKLDAAANANAANGQGLTWFLNGVEIDESAFPGVGNPGEESVYVQLTAGTQYQLRVVSDAPGANGLDYLDVQPAPGNANADIAVRSLDPAFLENRLHFSYIEDPDAVAPNDADRDFKDSGTVRISNTGTEALTLTDYDLTGPFVLANPTQLDGLSIAAGQSVDVTVLFNRAAYTPPTSNVDATSTIFNGALKLVTNDADNPVTTIDLAGFWQARDEGGQEPNVNEVWKVFGFGNVIEGLTTRGGGENSVLSTKDVFAKTDATEVLSPYWRLADGVTEAKITQIAAFHGTGGATLQIHNPGNKGSNVQFWNHEGTDNQRFLPNVGNDVNFATRTFGASAIPDGWAGNDIFGISVAGQSTDPRLNPRGDVLVPGAQQGHTVKVFQALDADGNVIPNVYLGVMDYTGINYDYNDNLFVIEGVAPVGFGQNMVVRGLDDAAADERLVFTSIDDPANGQQAFRNEATFTISNDGAAALTISSIATGNPAFQIVGAVPTTIAAGASASVTVRFTGMHGGENAGADLYKSTLTIVSDDYAQGQKVIQLAGLAQEFSENGSEPTVAQIVEAFGYGTDMAQGELAGGGVVEAVGDEVLLPYLQKLDATKAVEVIQIAAFLQQNNVARLGFHGLGSNQVTNLFAQDDQQYQTVLPDQLLAGTGAGANVARGTINGNDPFGLFISVDNRPTYASWSDPEANKIDPNFGQLVGDDQGHLIRYFQALDANGNAIEGTFIGVQDYPGAGNYDYNDHMFVIKNVKAYDLTAANDANNDAVNDALQLDADRDGTVNFFDTNTTPPTGPQAPFGGTAPSFTNGLLTVDASNYDTGGLGVAYNDNPGRDGASSFRPNDAVEVVGTENDIGYVRPGEWIEYTINVPESGAYDLNLLAKTPLSGATVAVSLAGGANLATITLQDGGTTFGNAPFQTSPSAAVTLPSGLQTIRLTFNGTPEAGSPYLLDLRSFSLDYREPPVATQTPVGETAPSFANGVLTVDASNYDNGGQGVAYNDAAGLQGGTTGGRAGSDVEQTASGDIGWIAPGEWVEYTIDVQKAGVYDLDLLLANGGGSGPSATVSFFKPGAATPYATSGSIANPGTGGWSTFVNRGVDDIALDAGTQIVRVAFAGGAQDFRSFTLTALANPQQPFGGTVPSFTNGELTVDASNFDAGGQGIAYNDNAGRDGGANFRPGETVEFVGSQNDIGYILPGEWVEYTVNVPANGVYDLSLLAKTPLSNATVAVSLAGGATLATVALQDGGTTFDNAPFQATADVPLTLPSGEQTIRLTFNGTPQAGSPYLMDLRSFSLDLQEPASNPQQPFGGTAPSFTDGLLTVDASNYDNGGQGIAYNDAAGLQGGTNGGRAGSAVEATGAGDIGWIAPGEWVEYTINVDTAGTYDLDLLLANGGGAGRSATVEFFKPGATTAYATSGSIANPSTGSFNSFQARGADDIDLDAGTQVVRVTFAGGSQDFRSFTLDLQEPASGARMAMLGVAEPIAVHDTSDFDGLASDGIVPDLHDLADQPAVPHAIFLYDHA